MSLIATTNDDCWLAFGLGISFRDVAMADEEMMQGRSVIWEWGERDVGVAWKVMMK